MKTNKSYSKRLRVTKKGKVISRVPGQNHFNARQSGTERQRRARPDTFHAKMTTIDKARFLKKK